MKVNYRAHKRSLRRERGLKKKKGHRTECLGGYSNSAVSHYSNNLLTGPSLEITPLSHVLVSSEGSHNAVSKGKKPILPSLACPVLSQWLQPWIRSSHWNCRILNCLRKTIVTLLVLFSELDASWGYSVGRVSASEGKGKHSCERWKRQDHPLWPHAQLEPFIRHEKENVLWNTLDYEWVPGMIRQRGCSAAAYPTAVCSAPCCNSAYSHWSFFENPRQQKVQNYVQTVAKFNLAL